MNLRKGIRRLAAAIGIPYFGFWALWAWSGVRLANYTEEELRKTEADFENVGYTTLLDLNAEANEQIGDAIVWGVFWPLIALIAAGIAYWVYRGFNEK